MCIIKLKNEKKYQIVSSATPSAFTILSATAAEIAPQLSCENLEKIQFLTDSGLISGIYTDKQLVSCTQSGDDVSVVICDRYDIVIDFGSDGRIAGIRYPKFAAPGDTVVEKLPDGELADYRYDNEQFIFDPLPAPPEPEPVPTTEERIKELESQNQMLMECLLEMSETVYA